MAHWTGSAWKFQAVAETDANYDHGSIYEGQDETWRMMAATGPGPRRYGTGGEIEMWTSKDRGGVLRADPAVDARKPV